MAKVSRFGSTHGLRSVRGRRQIVEHLVSRYKFNRVLDLGCGYGDFFNDLSELGVECVGTGVDVIPARIIGSSGFKYYEQDILSFNPDSLEKFDLVFSSHTVEHISDTGLFLKKFFQRLQAGGVFCIIWPPASHKLAGGHVHNFNMGLMLYNLVRHGVNCRSVEMIRCGYCLAIIGKYESVDGLCLTSNRYELKNLEVFFPPGVVAGIDGRKIPGVLSLRVPLSERISALRYKLFRA